MAVFPPDQRRVIRPNEPNFTRFPLPAVTAIDTKLNNIPTPYGFGTGIIISPNYVLTAAHNLYDKNLGRTQNEIRVTSSGNLSRLISRRVSDSDFSDDPGSNVNVATGLFFPTDYKTVPNRDNAKHDIAFLRVDDIDLISPSPYVGLIAFINPRDARGKEIQTAGYPVDNVSRDIPNNTGEEKRDLVLAPGAFGQFGSIHTTIGREMLYSYDIDTEAGQSGSPVWQTLDGDQPRVLGVHSRGNIPRNSGTLIDKDIYDQIMDQIEDDGDPNLLPENAIIGSDPTGVPGLSGGNDFINGTYRKERILGGGGNDTIFGAGADDRIEGEDGNDDLDGGTGDDQLTGGAGDDIIDGGTNTLAVINPFNRENDVAVYSANRSEYEIATQTIGGIGLIGIGGETVTTVTHLNGNGDDGTDTLTNIEILKFADVAVPLSSDDGIIDSLLNFFGGSGNDDIVGNILANLLRGNGGNDRLEGNDGDDTLKGNDGNDSLSGGDDNDLLQGGKNKDQLNGNGGSDRIFGDLGNDLLRGEGENDYISGGDGFDTVKGGTGNDSIAGGNGLDTLQGGDGNDNLNGNGGGDRIFGDLGNDLLKGQSGNDYLSGSDGFDTLKGQSGTDYVTGGNGKDLLQGGDGNDNLNGDGESDRIFGDLGNDLLQGGTGNDYLSGGNGFDTLTGGFGRDTLAGGVGQDSFLFERVEQLVDEVTDFNVEDDTLLFTASNFGGVSKGIISSEIFTIGASARDSSDRFIYDASSGDLFYDSDGIGSSLQIKPVQLDSNLSLTNNNFQIV